MREAAATGRRMRERTAEENPAEVKISAMLHRSNIGRKRL